MEPTAGKQHELHQQASLHRFCHNVALERVAMSDMTSPGELGIYLRSLRDRAATVRRLARDISDKAAVRDLNKHADELDRQAKELESKIATL